MKKKINLNINKDIFNEVYIPHLNNDKTMQIFFGGSSSGKSFFLCQRAVLDVLKGHNYLIVRKFKSSISLSVFNEIKKAILFFKLTEFFKINESKMIITCNLNKSQILFSGLDDTEKVKSITPVNGVVTRILIEEGTEITYEDYKQLTKRLRGQAKFKKSIVMAFNPISVNSWIYKEFFGQWDDEKDYYEDRRMSILRTTYKDNKFLDEGDISTLEDESDPYWYRVYTLGKFGLVGGLIFKNWKLVTLSDEVKDRFHNIKNGLDFGFTHPTAYVRVHYDRKYKKIYIFKEWVRTDVTNDVIAKAVKDIIGSEYITVESAEPRSIKELRSYDINCLEAKKGKDSVLHGIQWLQQHEILIDSSCERTLYEFKTYQWKKDKYGKVLNEPVNIDDDILSALRYSLESEMLQGRKGLTKLKRN